ncbi:CDP-glycerol glycerophosphotransferase family protein [Pseudomonas sp. yb_2]|uniref:CDP-glycerol glycerophosphotransferase family protein n=1 Tax=Pseudomonas sp. yb_2 TaxID=3367218 RepID=UPI00370C7361
MKNVLAFLWKKKLKNRKNSLAKPSQKPAAVQAPELEIIVADVVVPTPKKSATRKYSIVTAAYNVEAYLDEFLSSVTEQTIDFEKHIELIIVDDGSQDETANIAASWVRRHPKNIRYLYQQNAGQGAARNNGLKYATNEWVTFIDSDDLLSNDYFECIDKFINSNTTELKAVCANFIFYYENKKELSDSHPLRFRFANGNVTLPISNPGRNIALNVNAVFFKRARLIQSGLQFNPLVKPGFEDSLFVNSYLLEAYKDKVGFCADAKYIYRKRDNGTSTLDTAWQHPGRYDHQLRLGSLGLIKKSIALLGSVPKFIQRVAMYDIAWHINKVIRFDSDIRSLTKPQLDHYKTLMQEIFSHIEQDTLMNFELAGMWFFQKLGLVAKYKGHTPNFNISYIDNYDATKNLVKVKYFTPTKEIDEQVFVDNKILVPTYSKTRIHRFFDEPFLYERILWLQLGDGDNFRITAQNKPTRVTLQGKQFKDEVPIELIYRAFDKKPIDESNLPEDILEIRQAASEPTMVSKFGGCWLLMDRDNYADDNAEHLYRYISKHHPEIKAFFVLHEESSDYERLAREEFNLVAFDSIEHKAALINCAHFISSHADNYIFSDITKKHFGDLTNYKFTFLQHGVIHNDLSVWLNTKNIDCFITSTQDEFNSISGTGPYLFSSKEVAITGLPRHDVFYDGNHTQSSAILIMPTWRNNIVGSPIGNSNIREINPDFSKTEYAHHWKGLLNSQTLKKLATKNKIKVIFAPHVNIRPYINEFECPEYIEIWKDDGSESIQTLFKASKIMITDYSSVAFDMAAMNKSVIYYQFDESEFLSKHTSRPGYFDYRRDGFGPVCSSQVEVEGNIENLLNSDSEESQFYYARCEKTFVFHDGNNCRRTVEAIKKLELNVVPKDHETFALVETGTFAMTAKNWNLAIYCFEQAIASPLQSDVSVYAGLIKSLQESGDHKRSLEVLEHAQAIHGNNDELNSFSLQAIFKMRPINDAVSIYEKLITVAKPKSIPSTIVATAANHYLAQGLPDKALAQLTFADNESHPDIIRCRATVALESSDWANAADLWKQVLYTSPTEDHRLKLFEAQYNANQHQECMLTLKQMRETKDFGALNIPAAEIFFQNSKWADADKYWTLASQSNQLHADTWLKLARARRRAGNPELAKEALINGLESTNERLKLQETSLIHLALSNWDAAIESFNYFLSRKDLKPNRDAKLDLAYALHKSGNTLAAEKALADYNKKHGEDSRSAKIASDIKQGHIGQVAS